MGSEFLLTKPAMQSILVGKYPYLLIDESQDTKKELIDALLSVYREHKERWLIGMFGDTMQKIYLDGKSDLEACIPNEWCCPTKKMNHRSAKRIVRLANSIRAVSDGKTQQARTDAKDGSIRLFIVDSESEKEAVEWHAAHRMAEIALDEEWTSDGGCKRLILEHHMAAERLSFNNLYEPLNESKVFGDSLRKGEIKEIELLAKTVSNVVSAYKAGDKFAVSKVVFKNSPLLSKAVVRGNKDSQHESICNAKKAVDDLMTLWENDKDPTCISVLKKIQTTKLFEIGDRAEDILDDSYEGEDVKVLALREALNVPFSELQRYIDYVSDQTEFATHQGVKGLEYPRVMVILSDNEERGFLFDYEKLFGVKALTDTDLRNRREGKDNSLTRTARLFYAACTRAQEGLAIVVYTSSPQKAKATAIENGWFEESEIELVCSL